MIDQIVKALKYLILLLSINSCQAGFADYIPSVVKDPPYCAATIATAALGISYCTYYKHFYGYEPRWDWEALDINKTLSFKPGFLWGTASSALQTEGRITAGGKKISNSWTYWEEKKNIPEENRVKAACNHWELYKQDIQLAADLHMNCYRFSIEWSKIEPNRG